MAPPRGPWTYEVHELSEGAAGIVYGSDGMRLTAEDNTGLAPADCRWTAFDDDTYDGADSPTRGQIGFGATEREARDDLRRLLEECAEAEERS